MKGNQKIIDALNGLLAMELAAMDQYFIHSQMYLDWGLQKLYDRISHEFDDEKGHATVLIERMLFLEGVPDMVTRDASRWALTSSPCWKVICAWNMRWQAGLRVRLRCANRNGILSPGMRWSPYSTIPKWITRTGWSSSWV